MSEIKLKPRPFCGATTLSIDHERVNDETRDCVPERTYQMDKSEFADFAPEYEGLYTCSKCCEETAVLACVNEGGGHGMDEAAVLWILRCEGSRGGGGMITDDERREVAKELRKQLRYMRENEMYEKDIDALECGNRTYRNIAYSVEDYGNFNKGDYANIVELLADLIDRPTCRNNGNRDDRGFRCSGCGHEAWTYDDSGRDPSDFSFCLDCGAEVVEDDWL